MATRQTVRSAPNGVGAPARKLTHEKIDRLAYALARPGGKFDVPPPANYFFWVGAGFSKTAGIPLAEGVVDRLLDKRWLPGAEGSAKFETFCRLSADQQRDRQAQLRAWANEQKLFGEELVSDWASMYGRCLHLLPGEVDRQEFIIECIEEGRGRLNMAHLLLGQLIRNGFVNTVLTTNFDDLVLRALQLYFVVPSALDPDSTNTLLTNSRFVQVAYLHGRLASYRQRHTPTEVRDAIPGFENYLGQGLQDHGLVVVGYSGGEETPMHLLHKVLMERGTGPGRGLFWVTRDTHVDSLPAKLKEILALKDCYWLSGWDADQFMKKLCAWPGIGLGIPNPAEWMKGVETMLPDEARALLSQTSADERSPKARKDVDGSSEKPVDMHVGEPDWLTQARQFADKEPDKALEILAAARPHSDSRVESLQLWAEILKKLKRTDNAIEVARRAVVLFPDAHAAFELLGDVYDAADQYEEAIVAFRKARELGSPTAGLWLGIELYFAGRYEEAIAALSEISTDPEHKIVRDATSSWMGMALHRLGKNEEAIAKFEEVAASGDLHPADLTHWSEALEELGRHAEAAEKKRLHDEMVAAAQTAGTA